VSSCRLDSFGLLTRAHWLMATKAALDLPYSVEQWDDADQHVEEVIALVGDYRVVKAAFDKAVRERPGRTITLRRPGPTRIETVVPSGPSDFCTVASS
jgi:hypothetical protein